MKTLISSDKVPAPPGPYSPGLTVGEWIFLSGQGGFDPNTGKVVSDDLVEQTEQTFNNIETVLKAAGASLDDVISCLVHLVNLADFPHLTYAGIPAPALGPSAVDAHVSPHDGPSFRCRGVTRRARRSFAKDRQPFSGGLPAFASVWLGRNRCSRGGRRLADVGGLALERDGRLHIGDGKRIPRRRHRRIRRPRRRSFARHERVRLVEEAEREVTAGRSQLPTTDPITATKLPAAESRTKRLPSSRTAWSLYGSAVSGA